MKLHLNNWMKLDLANAAYSVVIAILPYEWWIVYQTDDKDEAFARANCERGNATCAKVYVLNSMGKKVRF